MPTFQNLCRKEGYSREQMPPYSILLCTANFEWAVLVFIRFVFTPRRFNTRFLDSSRTDDKRAITNDAPLIDCKQKLSRPPQIKPPATIPSFMNNLRRF